MMKSAALLAVAFQGAGGVSAGLRDGKTNQDNRMEPNLDDGVDASQESAYVQAGQKSVPIYKSKTAQSIDQAAALKEAREVAGNDPTSDQKLTGEILGNYLTTVH